MNKHVKNDKIVLRAEQISWEFPNITHKKANEIL